MIDRAEQSGERALSVSILGGRLSVQEEIGLPFQLEVMGALEGLGLVNESTGVVESIFPDLPPFAPPMPPSATMGLETLVVGFGIYVAHKLSDKAIDDLTSRIYAESVRPALKKLGARLRSRGSTSEESVLTCFDHWFDGSKVLVRIRVYTVAPQTADDAVVAEVLRRAVFWVNGHTVTHRVLTYEIRDGKIPSEPVLSEPV